MTIYHRSQGGSEFHGATGADARSGGLRRAPPYAGTPPEAPTAERAPASSVGRSPPIVPCGQPIVGETMTLSIVQRRLFLRVPRVATVSSWKESPFLLSQSRLFSTARSLPQEDESTTTTTTTPPPSPSPILEPSHRVSSVAHTTDSSVAHHPHTSQSTTPDLTSRRKLSEVLVSEVLRAKHSYRWVDPVISQDATVKDAITTAIEGGLSAMMVLDSSSSNSANHKTTERKRVAGLLTSRDILRIMAAAIRDGEPDDIILGRSVGDYMTPISQVVFGRPDETVGMLRTIMSKLGIKCIVSHHNKVGHGSLDHAFDYVSQWNASRASRLVLH